MADDNNHDDRTEQPTPRRLQKAREEGTVMRAHGVASAAVLAAGAMMLSFAGANLVDQLALGLRLGLSVDPAVAHEPMRLLPAAGEIVRSGFGIVAELLILLAVVGFVADVAIGGWVLSARPLVPDVSRIDPVAGFGRIFSRAAFVEILKSLIKFLVVGAIAVWLTRSWASAFLHLAAETWPHALDHAARLWRWMFLILAMSLAAVAALEVPYQFWEHRDRLKMSRQEIRDEMRELEGSPHTRRRIRALRRRLARMRMMTEVAKADVVVTNPEHYAAALSYREATMRAPRLVAKGTGLIAMRIREVAEEHGVPIIAAPPLARAMCRYVELDDEIPVGLYPPVAEVLAYVYRLRAAHAAGRPPPPPPERRFEPPAGFEA